MSLDSNISDLVKKLPHEPGVYQFLDKTGKIIYIGKAKDLFKRVSSYFVESDTKSYKTETLVRKITDIKYFIVKNEADALLLENNLIKENQPRYNILLKDDKTYPWICVKNESFPRVIVTRNFIQDGSEYFGPYASGLMVKTLIDFIRQLFKLRTCNLQLTPENINKKKFKRCLEYQLGNCLGPCEGLQEEKEYTQHILQIKEILKGNLNFVASHLTVLMENYSKNLHFEEAEIVKRKLDILERFKGKSTVVNSKISNLDVFSIIDEENSSYINFLKICNGAIIQAHNLEVIKHIEENQDDLFSTVIFDIRERFKSNAEEIVVPFKPAICIKNLKITIPLRGDKKDLLDLSLRNAASFRMDKMKAKEGDRWKDREIKVLTQLKDDLRLLKMPYHIECFDNSNIQGSNPVSSCVVFKSGKPQKSEYRHYNVKTVEGPNDFASMEEVVYRRYKRLIEDRVSLPDLIVIDGGKGQLHAAINSLKALNIEREVSIIGIAKRLEEIYMPGDPVPLYLDKNSYSLRLIQKIRDEAHRFGINFHKKKRSISQLQSAFTDIPGIGETIKEKLLKEGIDSKKILEMDFETLTAIVGKKAANILREYFVKSEQNHL
jgi:excinuclease ABC subunit C